MSEFVDDFSTPALPANFFPLEAITSSRSTLSGGVPGHSGIWIDVGGGLMEQERTDRIRQPCTSRREMGERNKAEICFVAGAIVLAIVVGSDSSYF
jgi:hypothetical protein